MSCAGNRPVNLYFKIILIIFCLAYLISPLDVIPDLLLPYIGWLDDSVVLATVLYMIRYGRLPNFIFRKKPPFQRPKTGETPFNRRSGTGQQAAGRDTAGMGGRKNPGSGSRAKQGPAQAKPRTPYDILGIRPTATKREIQAAYKAAIKKYHPDKLSHLGEEFSTLANEKFLEIQAAYETLMKRH